MRDSFMVPVIEETKYFEIETTHGTEFIPFDVVGKDEAMISDLEDYLSGKLAGCYDLAEPFDVKTGFMARMSAPGYLDATEWCAFDSESEAIEYLLEYHGTQDDSEWESWELELRLRLLELQGLGRFECVEHSSGYEVKDRVTDATHWVDDGVSFHDGLVIDAGSSGESVPDIGTEEFRLAYEEMLNVSPDETLEAYFPDQYTRENE